MEVRHVSGAPTLKANFASGVLRRSVSLPDILIQFTSEYFTHEKQESSLRLIDARPGSLRCRPEAIMTEMAATRRLVSSRKKTKQLLGVLTQTGI